MKVAVLRLRLPWVEDREVEAGEVLDIAGDEGEVVLKGCRCDETVGDGQRSADSLTFGRESSPAIRYAQRDGEYTTAEE